MVQSRQLLNQIMDVGYELRIHGGIIGKVAEQP
jgi:hypothetical protein